MDRLHRKKRSFGEDNLEFWYLTPTISDYDLVAAYKFIHAGSEEAALKNLNYHEVNAPYKLVKKGATADEEDDENINTIVWNAEKGFTIGYRDKRNSVMAGLENTNLRNLEKDAIKSVIIRAHLPINGKDWGGGGVSNYVQYIAQPSNYFGLSRKYCNPGVNGRDTVNDGYAICTSIKGNVGGEGQHPNAGKRGFILSGNGIAKYNTANEFVIIGGYSYKPKNKPTDDDVLQEANLTLYDGEYYIKDDEDPSKDRKTYYNSSTKEIQHMIYGGKSTRYAFMSTDTYWIEVKAAAFYNRLLTEQEHNDLVRMIWKL